MKRDPLDAPNAKRSKSVLVLQAPELSLDGSAATGLSTAALAIAGLTVIAAVVVAFAG